jgi:hypothetical protein
MASSTHAQATRTPDDAVGGNDGATINTTILPTPRLPKGETPEAFAKRLEQLWWDAITADVAPQASERPFPWKAGVARPTTQTLKNDMTAALAWARTWLGNDLSNPHLIAGGPGLITSPFGAKPYTFEAPDNVALDTIEDLARWLPFSYGKHLQEARAFFQEATTVHPNLWNLGPLWRTIWKLSASERAGFLDLLRFLRDHPALHTLDIRECVVPGLDTKWAERNSALVKAAKAIMDNATVKPTGSLRSVLGLKEHNRQTLWLRFHPDDMTGPFGAAMFALRPTDLMQLPATITQAVVVENLAPFEGMPLRAGQVAVFGNGKAIVSMLERAPALHDPNLELFYWGDMDSQGYLILDRARRMVPRLRSWRMSLADVLQCAHLGVEEPSNANFTGETQNLTCSEQEALDWIRRKKLRIEQEKLPATGM